MKFVWHNIIPAGRIKNFLQRTLRTFFPLPCKEHFDGKLYHYTFRNGITLKTMQSAYLHFISPLRGYLRYWKPKKDAVIIDGGAYRGMYSIYASKLIGDGGKIYAFEPNPSNLKQLKEHLALNGCTNVVPVEAGLWNEAGTQKISSEDANSSQFSDTATTQISVETIDSFMEKEGLARLDFVKMDIEGAELEALEGAAATMKKFAPRFAIASYHVRDGVKTWKTLEKMFAQMGYTAWTTSPWHLTTYAKKKN
jgi:FkbM family methyltransferase